MNVLESNSNHHEKAQTVSKSDILSREPWECLDSSLDDEIVNLKARIQKVIKRRKMFSITLFLNLSDSVFCITDRRFLLIERRVIAALR